MPLRASLINVYLHFVASCHVFNATSTDLKTAPPPIIHSFAYLGGVEFRASPILENHSCFAASRDHLPHTGRAAKDDFLSKSYTISAKPVGSSQGWNFGVGDSCFRHHFVFIVAAPRFQYFHHQIPPLLPNPTFRDFRFYKVVTSPTKSMD